MELLRKAQELDPLSQQLIDDVIWGSYHLGDYATCLEFSDKIRRIRPNTWLMKIASLGALEQQDERKEELNQFVEKYGEEAIDGFIKRLNVNDQELRELTRHFIVH